MIAQRVAAVITGIAAVVGVVVAVLWWAAPSLEKSDEGMVLVIGFLAAFLGMVGLIAFVGITSSARARGSDQERPTDPRSLWQRLPHWFLYGVGVVGLATVGSIVASLVGTGGYSQNPANSLHRCPWSIGTNHGLTNICVSHARWLATGDEFGRAFLGLVTVFLIVQCVVFTNFANRAQGQRPLVRT